LHTGANLAGSPPGGRTILATFVIAAAVVVALVFSLGVFSPPCTGLVCGPVPEPVIQGATVQVAPLAPSACQTASDVVTCRAFLTAGDHGVVSLNVSVIDQAGGQASLQVEFLAYSSAANYVSFTSMPICSHTSAPSYEDRGCTISGESLETFHFAFTVSRSYGDATPRWPDSISIVMWTNCCLP